MTTRDALKLKKLEWKRRFGTMTESEFREYVSLKRAKGAEKAQFAPPEDKAIHSPRDVK